MNGQNLRTGHSFSLYQSNSDMRLVTFFFFSSFFLFLTFQANAQQIQGSKVKSKTATTYPLPGTTDTITVYGNCSMCKKRIEASINHEKGVLSANWSETTQLLTLRYDEKQISLDAIQQRIAAVGHDTEKYRADNGVYKKLHKCCKYERPSENR